MWSYGESTETGAVYFYVLVASTTMTVDTFIDTFCHTECLMVAQSVTWVGQTWLTARQTLELWRRFTESTGNVKVPKTTELTRLA